MRLRAFICLVVLAGGPAAAVLPVHAQDVTEDWHLQVTIALQNNNCELALSLTEAARRTKDPEADYRFGLLHEWGQCVDQDDARALNHFVAAFDAGFTGVVSRIVLIYLEGRVAPEAAAERTWRQRMMLTFAGFLPGARAAFLRLALFDRDEVPDGLTQVIVSLAELENGDSRVLYETALRVRDAEGWPRDYDVAARWLERAGDGGITEAGYEAAQLLFDPERGRYDALLGEMLLARAARDGIVEAQVELGRRLASGDRIERWDYAAYVWLLIAKGNGADVDGDLDRIRPLLGAGQLMIAPDDARQGYYSPAYIED